MDINEHLESVAFGSLLNQHKELQGAGLEGIGHLILLAWWVMI